jgi:hypothetical protein
MAQHAIKHEDVIKAWVLLAAWEREFEELYYQRRNDRLHFIRPCVHQILHLAPQTFQKGPGICTAQWTIERNWGRWLIAGGRVQSSPEIGRSAPSCSTQGIDVLSTLGNAGDV